MAHIKKLEYDINMDNAKNSDILAMGIFEDQNDSKLINSQMKGKVGLKIFRKWKTTSTFFFKWKKISFLF